MGTFFKTISRDVDFECGSSNTKRIKTTNMLQSVHTRS